MMSRWFALLPLLLITAWLCTACVQNAPGNMVVSQPEATPAPGPLTGWTVLVDPGHGGYDGGACCVDSGVWEKQLNLNVALAVERALTDCGARVIMTRREDIALCGETPPAAKTKKRQDMEQRVALAVENKVDAVLSIHMNEYRLRSESGPQVFYRKGCETGRLLAGCMQEALITGLQPRKHRAAAAGDYFILQLAVPSVLIECGFISNAEDERLLLIPAYQEQLALAVADGLTAYAKLHGK